MDKLVKPIELIELGVPKAVYWNVDIEKEIPECEFIPWSLMRGFNESIINIFFDFFGEEKTRKCVEKHRESFSDYGYMKLVEIMDLISTQTN